MKLKQWADALQGFILRALSSFLITAMVLNFELLAFAITHGIHELKCTFVQGYWAISTVWWLCFHLLIYRKDAS